MKIDPYCRQRRCSPVTLDSDTVRLMRNCGYIGSLERASNDSGVIENVDFHGFRKLRLRYLRK